MNYRTQQDLTHLPLRLKCAYCGNREFDELQVKDAPNAYICGFTQQDLTHLTIVCRDKQTCFDREIRQAQAIRRF